MTVNTARRASTSSFLARAALSASGPGEDRRPVPISEPS